MEVYEEENAPYPAVNTISRGVMVLCKSCEQYNRLLKDTCGKGMAENVWIAKLSKEERERMAPILKYLDNNSIITTVIGYDLLGKLVATTKCYLNRLCEIGILN